MATHCKVQHMIPARGGDAKLLTTPARTAWSNEQSDPHTTNKPLRNSIKTLGPEAYFYTKTNSFVKELCV